MENQVREREELLVMVPVLGLRRSEEEEERGEGKEGEGGRRVELLQCYSLRERIRQAGINLVLCAHTHIHTHTHTQS